MHTQETSHHTFSETFLRHKGKNADKWEGYLQTYDQVLTAKGENCEDILEIGVNNGGSLEVWAKYFPKANTITGVDINPKCKLLSFEDKRIHVAIGCSNSTEVREMLQKRAECYDLVIDDGSHKSDDIVKTFFSLVGLVSPGGTYVIEDLSCSYWQEFGGGVRSEDSAMALLKKLADIVNFEHWNSSYSLEDYLGDCGIHNIPRKSVLRIATIRSVTFYNSMCVIDFAKISSERLIGKRVCRGCEVAIGLTPVNGQDIKRVGGDQSGNPLNIKKITKP